MKTQLLLASLPSRACSLPVLGLGCSPEPPLGVGELALDLALAASLVGRVAHLRHIVYHKRSKVSTRSNNLASYRRLGLLSEQQTPLVLLRRSRSPPMIGAPEGAPVLLRRSRSCHCSFTARTPKHRPPSSLPMGVTKAKQDGRKVATSVARFFRKGSHQGNLSRPISDHRIA